MAVYRGRTNKPNAERAADTALAAFIEMRGLIEAFQRFDQMRALPQVEWKGKTLYTIRCHGTRGKGPHTVHVPESVLWSLIDIRAFRCPYHFGD